MRIEIAQFLPVFVSALCFAANSGGADADALLLGAVKQSNVEEVRTLLKKGASARAREADGTTALHWAAEHGDQASVELLLDAGADVKAVNRYGVNPLLAASGTASAALIERLLKAGADPKSSLPEGETAVMMAAREGKADVIQTLYKAGADVNAKESWHHQTALMWAAAGDHATAVETLKELGADLNARSDGGFTALLFAARDGSLEAIKALIRSGAPVNDTIQLEIKKGPVTRRAPAPNAYVERFNRLEKVRQVGPEGTSALVLAIENLHFTLAKYLIEQGAEVNAAQQGWTPLIMLEYVRRPNAGKGLPPPEFTDTLDSMTLAKILVDHGANVNARQTEEIDDKQRTNQNRVGATAFFIAAKHADLPMMMFLLDHNADPLIKTEDGVTALAAASGVGIFNVGESAGSNEEALEAVKLAYEVGCSDVNAVDEYGYTALHGAALRGSPEIIKFLVEHGADFNVKTRDEDWTPLRIADGVFYTSTLKRSREAGEMLRRLMRERGLTVADMDNTVDNGYHQIVKQ